MSYPCGSNAIDQPGKDFSACAHWPPRPAVRALRRRHIRPDVPIVPAPSISAWQRWPCNLKGSAGARRWRSLTRRGGHRQEPLTGVP